MPTLQDIRAVQGGFPQRDVKQIDIGGLPVEAPELRLSALLDEYRRLREALPGWGAAGSGATGFCAL